MKPIEVDGSNEMGQLAESLRHMQGELMRTVGDVRNLGRKSLEEVINKLAMMGLSLASDDSNS